MAQKTLTLDYVPRSWQAEVHQQRKRFSVLALHRRAGKTKLGVMQLIDAALRCDKPDGLFYFVAPELKQAHAIAWRELKSSIAGLRQVGAVSVREGDLSVTFRNGAMIRLYGADNPDAIRGVRLDGCVLDEVAQMRGPEIWHEIIQPALADRLGWALFIGTPHGINLFSELFALAAVRQAEGDANWFAARYTVDDTDALQPAEVERLHRDMDENAWAREMLCDFSASGDDQVISLGDAENAANRKYDGRERTIQSAPIVLGVDPARFGDDRSVIVRRQGLACFEPIILRHVDNMELASRVAAQMERHGPAAVFIDSGAGAGVIDRLRQLGHTVVEVPFGGKALDPEQYKNRRTEMWWNMRSWILAGGAIPNILQLKKELATPTYTYDAVGRKVLESKDQIKRRLDGSSSPDIADALCLTFAAPVANRRETWVSKRKRSPTVDYDPYASGT